MLTSKTLNANFISWDDAQQVTNNPNVINGISFKNTYHIFNSMVTKMYQPLTTLVYNIEYSIFGNNPKAFHTIGLIIHLINIILVFKLFLGFFKRKIYAILSALIFATHPLQVESVAWVSAQSTLLYALFYLLAMLTYIKFIKNKKINYYWLTLLLFLLSLFSKVMAVSLPILLFAFDFYYKRKLNWKIIVEKIPFILLSFIFSLKAISGKGNFLTKGFNDDTFSNFESIFLFPFQLKHYFIKFIYPNDLCALYDDPKTINTIPYMLFIILFIVLLFKIKKHFRKKIIFGLLLFIMPLLPIFKIKPIGHSLLFDRYAYLCLLGLIFLVVLILKNIKNKIIYKTLVILLIIFISVNSYISYKRVSVWNNSLSVWNDVIDTNKQVQPLIYYERGLEELKQAEIETNVNRSNNFYNLAIKDFTTIINKENAIYWRPYYKRGLCYLALGNKINALTDFNKSTKIVSKKTITNINEKKVLANLYQDKQKLQTELNQ